MCWNLFVAQLYFIYHECLALAIATSFENESKSRGETSLGAGGIEAEAMSSPSAKARERIWSKKVDSSIPKLKTSSVQNTSEVVKCPEEGNTPITTLEGILETKAVASPNSSPQNLIGNAEVAKSPQGKTLSSPMSFLSKLRPSVTSHVTAAFTLPWNDEVIRRVY